MITQLDLIKKTFAYSTSWQLHCYAIPCEMCRIRSIMNDGEVSAGFGGGSVVSWLQVIRTKSNMASDDRELSHFTREYFS